MLARRAPAAFGTAPARLPPRASLVVSHSYKNLENINLSRLPEFALHENDTGSPEYQVARLNARVEQLGTHLKANKKDFAALRGLQAILAQRKRLLQYLYRIDRESYYWVIEAYGIRGVVVGDTRGVAREKESEDKKFA